MRSIFVLAIAFMLLCQPSNLKAQRNSDVIKAFESGFKTVDDFKTVYNFVLPSEKDTRWRQVPWIPSLWQGMQIAGKKNKPMFIWAMNGDRWAVSETMELRAVRPDLPTNALST